MERAATAARVCRQLQDDLDPLNDARIRTAIIARDNWNLRSVGPLAKAENRSQRNEWHVQHSPFLLFALLCGCEAFLRNPQPASALWLRRKPWTSPSTAALYSAPPISGGTCVAAADAKTNALASSEIAASAIAMTARSTSKRPPSSRRSRSRSSMPSTYRPPSSTENRPDA